MGVSVIVGVNEGVNVNVAVGDGVIVGVGVMVGVWVQVGADRIGPETPITREVRNFSTMPSRSALRVTDGQILLRSGRKNGCSCSTWIFTRSPGPPASSISSGTPLAGKLSIQRGMA